MKYYSRKEIAQKYKISLSGVRKLLRENNIQPAKIKFSLKNLPQFLYSQQSIENLKKQKQHLKKCCVCGAKQKATEMQGTRCNSCYVKRYCNLIVYGKDPWDKIIQPDLIQKALHYLNSFRPTTK